MPPQGPSRLPAEHPPACRRPSPAPGLVTRGRGPQGARDSGSLVPSPWLGLLTLCPVGLHPGAWRPWRRRRPARRPSAGSLGHLSPRWLYAHAGGPAAGRGSVGGRVCEPRPGPREPRRGPWGLGAKPGPLFSQDTPWPPSLLLNETFEVGRPAAVWEDGRQGGHGDTAPRRSGGSRAGMVE